MVKKFAAFTLGSAILLCASACSSSLNVEPAPGSEDPYCEQLSSILPVDLGGALLRDTNPDSTGTKAWGDPAIVLRCGVATPDAYSEVSQLLTVNNLDWFPEELQAGVRFTSVGTTQLIEISIPASYEATADILTELSSTIVSLTS